MRVEGKPELTGEREERRHDKRDATSHVGQLM